MSDLSHIVLKPDDFEQLAAMCRLDVHFPASYGEWSVLIKAAGHQARDMAVDNEPLTIDPSTFRRWCWKVEIVPSLDALRAYAIVQRRRKDAATRRV